MDNFLEVTGEEDYYQIQTSKVKCVIQKQIWEYRFLIYTELFEDELGFHWEESYEHGGNIVKMSKASKDGECFMALEIKRPKWILKGKD
jgi:alpha-glucosidase